MTGFNHPGVWAIFKFEMARWGRTLWQSLVTPVITTSLYFVVYENNGSLSGGHMYVENMQVGVLSPENAGTNVIKASVAGNTATNIAFQLHKSPGSVMVANYGSNPSRVEVCKASYKYQ